MPGPFTSPRMTAPDFCKLRDITLAAAENAGIGTVVEGHGFTDCRKTGACVQHRGRAALQGRESHSGSVTALAAVATICHAGAFFGSLFSRAVSAPDQMHGAPKRRAPPWLNHSSSFL